MSLRSLFLVLCFICMFIKNDARETDIESESCSQQLHGTDWLLSIRNKDYGWGDETHRAVITLFMKELEGKIKISQMDKELMTNQLELELSIAMMKNSSRRLSQSELSLYIHALLVAGINPRDFKGMNLVSMLENIFYTEEAKPISFLCLCNSKASLSRYMTIIHRAILNVQDKMDTASKESLAMLLTVYACFDDENNSWKINEEVKSLVSTVTKVLAHTQLDDGSFGNIYTTAIVAHALKAIKSEDWNRHKAEQYMKSNNYANILSIYFVEMALREHLFIKDVSPQTAYGPSSESNLAEEMEARFTIKAQHPQVYHSLNLKIPDTPQISMLDLMELAKNENPNFNFSYRIQDDKPYIYSINEVSNSVEDGFYWKLFREKTSPYIENGIYKYAKRPEAVVHSIKEFTVKDNDHFIYSYELIK